MNSRHHQSEQHSRHSCLGRGFLTVVLAALLGGIGGVHLVSTSVWADQPGTAQVDNSSAGQITDVGAAFLEVERRSYRLDPKLEIRTESGQPMELTQLQVGMGVRLQLKDGALFKVMVMNPR